MKPETLPPTLPMLSLRQRRRPDPISTEESFVLQCLGALVLCFLIGVIIILILGMPVSGPDDLSVQIWNAEADAAEKEVQP